MKQKFILVIFKTVKEREILSGTAVVDIAPE